MRIERIHSWDFNYSEARKIQKELATQVRLTPLKEKPRLIAGADVAYSRKLNLSFGMVVVFEFPSLDQVGVYSGIMETTMPYIPGLLSFREAPVLLSVFGKVKEKVDLVIFDGQGIAHPRGFGLASHLGLFLNTPTIGCAKSKLVGEHQEIEFTRGNRNPVWYKDKICAYVLCSKDNVKPLYVSPGHLMDFNGTCEYVLLCDDGFRLPKPTRIADQLVAKYKKEFMEREAG